MNQFDNTNAPYKIPKSLVAGDYVAWRNSSYTTDYDPASYTLTYNFRLEGEPAREFVVTGSADSSEYLFEISISESSALKVGLWHYDLYVTQISDSKRITLDQGQLKVVANKADASTDPRDLPRKMLAEIERAMLSRATNNQLDTLAYSLGVETSATRDTEKLITWRSYWRKELIKANRKWRARNGLPHSGLIKVQF